MSGGSRTVNKSSWPARCIWNELGQLLCGGPGITRVASAETKIARLPPAKLCGQTAAMVIPQRETPGKGERLRNANRKRIEETDLSGRPMRLRSASAST